MPKKWQDGRQDAGCNYFLGFLLRKNPKPKKWQDAPAWRPAVSNPWSLREAQTPKGEKRHGGRFFARARDRRGAEQPRREAAGPERSGAPYSPVFCGPPWAGRKKCAQSPEK
jgi:hypothetical protein